MVNIPWRRKVPWMNITSLRAPRRAAVAAMAITVAVLGGAGVGWAAAAATAQPAIKTITPRSERDVPNIDVLRQQRRIDAGAPLVTGQSAVESKYDKEADGVAAGGARFLSHSRSH